MMLHTFKTGNGDEKNIILKEIVFRCRVQKGEEDLDLRVTGKFFTPQRSCVGDTPLLRGEIRWPTAC